MTPFTVLAGTAIPMVENNIDTDQLCPKQHLLRLEKTGFDRALFSDRRFDANGVERPVGLRSDNFVPSSMRSPSTDATPRISSTGADR